MEAQRIVPKGDSLLGAWGQCPYSDLEPKRRLKCLSPGWLRTEENNFLACPPEVARTLPRQAQEVLGYAVHDALQSGGGYCGMLDLRDPCDMLADGSLG